MGSDYRHHVARPAVILVLLEAGSPKNARAIKPRYPQQTQRQPWKPASRPPSKAESLRKLLERMNRQNGEIRAFMAEARRRAA
jgi:hypothetical protein